jgi:5'-3' exonuclease
MGDLSFDGVKTGVIFGFLREIINLKERFSTDHVVFCFDLGEPRRRQILDCYKAKRHAKHRGDLPPQALEAHKEMQRQMHLLRTLYLPRIGYKNILWQHGYEADDIIASVSKNLPADDEAIIVSADGDLFQLLKPNVSIYNPNKQKFITLQSFKRDVGLHPKYWARVKAMAGCKGDEIPGIQGVGEATAIKYILGTLKETHAVYKRILESKELVLFNKQIVKLPFEGTEVFDLKADELSNKGWAEVCTHLGLKSLASTPILRGGQAAAKKTGFQKYGK